jgi:4-hydroxy-tetrahydrodipicolinate synthase
MTKLRANNVKGIIPPLITPTIGKNQEVDEEGIREHVNFVIEGGVHGVFPCGGTGEYSLMTREEHKKVNEIVIDEVNSRVPVIAGAGSPSTANAIDFAKAADDAGADAVMAITPYYYRHGSRELFEHFKAMSAAIGIPVLVYNCPFCSASSQINMDPEFIAKLADFNIIGIKDSTSQLSHLCEIIELAGERISVLQGMAEYLLPSLCIGAKGCVAVPSQIVPELYVELYDAFQKRNLQKARELHYKLLPLSKLQRKYNIPAPVFVKEADKALGMNRGVPKKPLAYWQMPKKATQQLKDILKNLGYPRAR